MAESGKTTEFAGPEDIMRVAGAFQRSRALLSAFELDLFTALGESGATAEEAAAKRNTAPRATHRLLCALAAMGLVGKSGERFSNTAVSARYLSRNSPECLTNLNHLSHVYESWAGLPESVRTDTPADRQPETDERRRRDFIEAMHRRAAHTAGDLVAGIDLSGVSRVLDVGGGSGVYAMAMCRAKPGLAAVVLDRPEVVELTREYVTREGMEDCVSTMAGDYLEDDFGSGFDLVFFSAIVHINSFDENRELMARAAAALNPGGMVAVQDFVMEEDRINPPRGALFSLNMLVNTKGGDTYTASEITSWLHDAGLFRVERIPTGPETAMLTARKAG